jgi:uncharacterized protein
VSTSTAAWPSLPPGKHYAELVAAGQALPLLLVRGARPGPALAVTAGVHGDEYEGPRAVYDLFEQLSPEAMRGSFAQQFIAHADFFLDLHSGGLRFAMPSMAGYWAEDPRARAAAEIFGAPVTWAHPAIEPGRTISFAQSRNIPFLYTEARGAARIHPEDLAMMVRGMRNLLCHLSILDGVPEIPAPPRRLHGPGNTDAGMQTKTGGFLIPHVELLETVQEGQLLARVTDLHGRTLETLLAPRSGVVALRREMPAVSAGDTVCILAAEM